MPTLLSATFNDDRVTTMALRHYHFVVKTIEKLEEEIERQVVEQQSILMQLLRRCRFHEHITPIVADYRRCLGRTSAPIATSPISSSLPSSLTDIKEDHTPEGGAATPPPTTCPDNIEVIDDNDSPPSTYATAETSLGSSQNPIDVDQFQFGQEMYDNQKFQDILNKTKEPPRFKPTCERCGQIRHDKPDCDTPICSFIHCKVCEYFGKRQSMYCGHVDLSPVAFQRMRGNIPYDDSN